MEMKKIPKIPLIIGAIFTISLAIVIVTTITLKKTELFRDLQEMPRKNLSGLEDFPSLQDDAGCQTRSGNYSR